MLLSNVDVESLTHVERIPLDSLYPAALPTFSQAPESPSKEWFIKRPKLIDFTPDSQIPDNVLREINVCEVIRQKPHRNIAEYHSCDIKAGRVADIYFKRYLNDLQHKLNPKALNKVSFQGNDRPRLKDALRYLKGIEAGLNHLHSLGLTHNDITPANIILDHDDEPIIIVFDSCLKHGKPLTRIKRTYGWHDEKVQISQPFNDLEVLAELRTWLISSKPEDFRFMN